MFCYYAVSHTVHKQHNKNQGMLYIAQKGHFFLTLSEIELRLTICQPVLLYLFVNYIIYGFLSNGSLKAIQKVIRGLLH